MHHFVHHHGFAPSNWPRLFGLAPVLVALLPALHTNRAAAAPRIPRHPPMVIASLIVTPPTLAADNLLPINGGTCANYSSSLATMGVSVNGVSHPGDCQFTGFELLFEGLPFPQYWQAVTSGALPAPYTVSVSRPLCYDATNLRVHISARVQTSRLNWVSGKPAASVCTKEWNRTQTAASAGWPNSSALLTDAASVLSQVSQNFGATRLTTFKECGPNAAALGVPPRQRIANRVEQLLAAAATQAQADWTTTAAQFEGTSPQAACALHCNLCDYPGWAGTISLTESASGPDNFAWNASQTYYVGGPSQISGAFTLYPAAWEMPVLNGSKFEPATPSSTSHKYSWNCKTQALCSLDYTSNIPLTNAPVQFRAWVNSSNQLIFDEWNTQFAIPSAGLYRVTNGDGTSSQSDFDLSEIRNSSVVISGPANATELTNGPTPLTFSYTNNGTDPIGVCNLQADEAGTTCTQTWSWDLQKQ